MVASAKGSGDSKVLGLFDVFAIAAGAMISSGLFVLPGIAFAEAGPAVVLAYALAIIGILPVMLAKAELATAMPMAGGSYFFIERSLGPLAGTIAGFANWLSIALKTAFALVGIGALALSFFPEAGLTAVKATALVALLLFTVINVFGAGKSGKLQVVLVFALIAILALFILTALPDAEPARFAPFMPSGFGSVLAVAGMVFVSYGGLTKVASVASEVVNPQRNLPLGMFMAIGIVSVLYLGAVFVVVGVSDPEMLSGSLTPLYDAAKQSSGNVVAVLVDIAAFLAFATTANAGILAASRSPLAMARDGLVPAWLAKTSPRFGTPLLAILFTSLFLGAVIAALSVEDLVKTASTMLLCMFAMVQVSLLIMRYSGLENYRPTFRMPGVPFLPLLSIGIYFLLIAEMGWTPLLLSFGFCLVALCWYIFYVHRRIDRESALVYLVKRVVSKSMVRPELESELKQITIERDDIARDRFDHLVDDALILDIAEPLEPEVLFRKIASGAAAALDVAEDRLYELFLEREKSSSTVLTPELAVPHIIIEGEKHFELVVVRAPGGVRFSKLQPPVHCIFALIGTADERNFHLQALMHIARLVSEAGFQQRWDNARNAEGLRDVIHLAKRERSETWTPATKPAPTKPLAVESEASAPEAKQAEGEGPPDDETSTPSEQD